MTTVFQPLASPPATAAGKRWVHRGSAGAAFSHGGLPQVITQMLAARGIESAPLAESFLSGALDREHDAHLLPQIDAALDRIAGAITRGEKIAVYGDYDVDGVTATAILVEGIGALGGNVIPYLPNRFVEGYGVNSVALSELRRGGVSLVITADCGISAFEEVAFGNEIGLDTIVVDHHSIPPRLPDAVALVDPKLDGCLYPCTELAACGLAYKLVPALAQRLGLEYDHRVNLDLAALGTVCDMAPLTGENRWIVRHGLKALARTHRPGIRALAEVSGSQIGNVDAEMLGFRLGPRLNAAGRLYNAGLAYELVTTTDEGRARVLAERLNTINAERQRLTTEAVALARSLVEAGTDRPVLLVGAPGISQGIVGLVAGRLAEQYGRPAFVYEEGGKHSRGSARGVPGYDVVEALQAAAPMLVRFGGHRQAGGFTAETARLHDLRAFLTAHAEGALGSGDRTPFIEYDVEVAAGSLTPGVIKWLRYMEPFGQANPEPVFCSRGLRVQESRIVGNDRSHLVLRLSADGAAWRCIAFGLAHAAPPPGAIVDVLFAHRIDARGRPDLHIKDFAISGG